nr:alanine racemase [Desulfuromonas sp.]
MSIESNIRAINDRITAACARAGRYPASVRLVAVSKTKPAEMVEEAYIAGQTLFGESYAQEFSAKTEQVGAPVEWHFVGGLQTNKVKYLRGRTALIHSVDRLSLAKEIDRQWGKLERKASVLIQLNLGGKRPRQAPGRPTWEPSCAMYPLCPTSASAA